MGKFAIKKRISLEFLGTEYKDAFLVFKSIPIKDFKEIVKEIDKTEDDSKTSLEVISKYLQDYFIEGKFPNDLGELEAVTKEDLSDFVDSTTANKCFELLTGQNIDPKPEAPLMNSSSTEPDSPSKS